MIGQPDKGLIGRCECSFTLPLKQYDINRKEHWVHSDPISSVKHSSKYNLQGWRRAGSKTHKAFLAKPRWELVFSPFTPRLSVSLFCYVEQCLLLNLVTLVQTCWLSIDVILPMIFVLLTPQWVLNWGQFKN